MGDKLRQAEVLVSVKNEALSRLEARTHLMDSDLASKTRELLEAKTLIAKADRKGQDAEQALLLKRGELAAAQS